MIRRRPLTAFEGWLIVVILAVGRLAQVALIVFAVVLIVGGLAGCSSMPNSVTVRVPIPVPCVAEVPAKPPFATDTELAALPDDQFVLRLGIDRRDRQAYEARLEAQLAACS